MSIPELACVVAGIGIVMPLLLLYIVNKQKNKEMSKLLNRFSELGTFYNLSFSSQVLFSNSIIGLDGISRKLLVLIQRTQTSFEDYVINLDEVKGCTVKKYYDNIKPGDLTNKKPETYLQQIALRFEFINETEALEVIYQLPQGSENDRWQIIEHKAEQWKQMLTKMLKAPAKVL